MKKLNEDELESYIEDIYLGKAYGECVIAHEQGESESYEINSFSEVFDMLNKKNKLKGDF